MCSWRVISVIAGCRQTAEPQEKPVQPAVAYSVQNSTIAVEFDKNLHSRVVSNLTSTPKVLGAFQPSEYVILADGDVVNNFAFVNANETKIDTELGAGSQFIIMGKFDSGLRKTTSISRFDRYPSMLFFNLSYKIHQNNRLKSPSG